jgi:hypothetical protein
MNKKFLSLVACVATAAQAQIFTTDVRTVATDSSSAATATRLFLDGAFSSAVPANQTYNLWFVADTAGNGVPTIGVTSGSLLGADDRVLFTDRVDGDQPGSTAGRYRRQGASISSSVASGGVTETSVRNSSVFVYLWNNTDNGFNALALANGTVPSVPVGTQFGVYNMGTFTVPELGNAFWGIDQNVNATQFTVVPEPGEYAAMAGGALVAFAIWRRRQQRSNA